MLRLFTIIINGALAAACVLVMDFRLGIGDVVLCESCSYIHEYYVYITFADSRVLSELL